MKKEDVLLLKVTGLALVVVLAVNVLPGVFAATSDTVTASVTIPQVLNLSDDATNLSIGSLTVGSADTTQGNTLTVEANRGFTVTVGIEDIQTSPIAGQLSDDASGTNIFDADGTSSYVSVTSTGSGITGSPTYTSSETKLGTSAVTVISAPNSYADGSGADSQFDVDYDVFADHSIFPTTYQGTITFTIAPST